MASALEQSFADICEKRGLHCIGLNMHPKHEGAEFTVYTHSGEHCGSGSRSTIAEALAASLAELNSRRNAPVAEFADEALPEPVE